MTVEGVDYSSGRPGGAALKAAGKTFVMKYLSYTGNPKNLTRAEADDLAAHGLWCGVVFETTAGRAGQGRAAGVTDAQKAITQAAACGKPADRPVYFAVDYDANPAAVAPYFQGVISVLGLARTGAYGGYRVIKYLLDNKLTTYAWQTAAWSANHWDPRAHIRQAIGTQTINGVACDRDTAYAADYGQWKPGVSPVHKEDDVPLTDAEIEKIAERTRDLILTYRNQTADAASMKATGQHIPDFYGYAVNTSKAVAKLPAAVQPQIDYAKLALALIQAAKGA